MLDFATCKECWFRNYLDSENSDTFWWYLQNLNYYTRTTKLPKGHVVIGLCVTFYLLFQVREKEGEVVQCRQCKHARAKITWCGSREGPLPPDHQNLCPLRDVWKISLAFPPFTKILDPHLYYLSIWNSSPCQPIGIYCSSGQLKIHIRIVFLFMLYFASFHLAIWSLYYNLLSFVVSILLLRIFEVHSW